MTAPDPASPLAHTPLHALHLRLGARMVAFAGYEMPVQYPSGIIKEHLHTRAAAGLFDVSHMGQIVVRPRSGRIADAARALESLVPADILGLPQGRQRYTQFTNAAGGVLDDLMVSNEGDHLRLVVNAAGKAADEAHLRAHLAAACEITPQTDLALIALQGPKAESVLAILAPDVSAMRFMETRRVPLLGTPCLVSRSGYTGEDGFEISVPEGKAQELCVALMKDAGVAPVGLGARDSLRLEAGLCLYGSDLDPATTPVEAALDWSIQKTRRAGGARAGGFPGADVILSQLAAGPARRRVGLRPEGRIPVRHGAALYRDGDAPTALGVVSSGGFGPSIDGPVAMGYVPTADAVPGTMLFADVRGKRLPVQVVDLPFVPSRYKRA
jgi:aminomethyltransferase